jgi:type IV pilus assembly protein PilA
MKTTKGFTLIELLVVIAIVGILSSVVLASLNTARGKGANAAIKANMANMRAQAEIYYDGVGANTYGSAVTAGGCSVANTVFMDAVIQNALIAIQNANGGTLPTCKTNGSAPATAWAMSAVLKVAEGANAAWCVDSTGNSKAISTQGSLVSSSCP